MVRLTHNRATTEEYKLILINRTYMGLEIEDIEELSNCINHDAISDNLSESMRGSGLIVRNQIIELRHWTPELINKYLVPIEYDVNPHNNTQNMRIYSLKDVIKAEKNIEFQEHLLNISKDKLSERTYRFYEIKLNKMKRERMHPAQYRKSCSVSQDQIEALEKLGFNV